MKPSPKTLVKLALGAVLVGALSGAAFAAWANNGDEMLASMFQAGLAWCL